MLKPRPKAKPDDAGKPVTTPAEKRRDRDVKRKRKATEKEAELGDIPLPEDLGRLEKFRFDLFGFLQWYFPGSTGKKPFSDDHRQVISIIQTCILEGGFFINAVYRGFAKTSICEGAAIWAALYGHRRFVVIYSVSDKAAKKMIRSIRMELSENDRLAADFPEICLAFQALGGSPQRKASQTYKGELTHIDSTTARVQMPRTTDHAGGVNQSAGCIIESHGISGGETQGLREPVHDGTKQRPDFVILDDPQSKKAAKSASQVETLLDIINRSILKLGGHETDLACVVNATPAQPGDAVEQLLDPIVSPAWVGVRIPMVRAFSKAHETHWLGEYATLRRLFKQGDPASYRRAIAKATAFYLANQAAMDDGAEVSWEHCYSKGEVSAVQHAYNQLIDLGLDVFNTECQCQTEHRKPAEDIRVPTLALARRCNGFQRRTYPQKCDLITVGIDIQDRLLYWMACAWARDFTGFVLDYGTWPDQRRSYFTYANAQQTLATEFPGESVEYQIHAGLTRLTDQLYTNWPRVDGLQLRPGIMLIDASGHSEQVKGFCHTTKHQGISLPRYGIGIGADRAPMEEWRHEEGETRGPGWRMRSHIKGMPCRHVLIDVNQWKSNTHSRLRTPYPTSSSLSFFGAETEPHDMLADHINAEVPERKRGKGRELDEFTLPPGQDNHLWDCLVECVVGASILGAALPSSMPQEAAGVVYVDFRELAAKARGGRRG